MDKIFSFIPENLDKNIKLVLIFLIPLQFTAFLLYMFFMIKDFLKVRKERIENENKKSDDENLNQEESAKNSKNEINNLKKEEKVE